MSLSAKTIVTDAEGKVTHFYDIVSKLAAAHPKGAIIVALAAGFLLRGCF
jgi:hypothetical protein